MTIHLNSASPTRDINFPSNTAEATIASVGDWSGTVKVEYGIEDETGTLLFSAYEDGEFTENFSKVFHPASNVTRLTLVGTGDVHINLVASRVGSRS